MVVGGFDLEVGAGDLMHFEIDLRQTTVNEAPASQWAGDIPSPFGTYDNPIPQCARVTYYISRGGSRVAENVHIFGRAAAAANPCARYF